MRDKSKMEANIIYVEKDVRGSSNNSVIWVTGKPIPQNKFFYIKDFEGNNPLLNMLEVFKEIEWWRKLGYDIKFDGFLEEAELKDLRETKNELEKKEE